jgi:flagellar motor switch protein FliN/FliY
MPDTQIALNVSGDAARRDASKARIGMSKLEEHRSWTVLSRLPVLLTVRIGISPFSVRDLLALEPGQILASRWSQTRDVPLSVGEVRLGWSEFEVSGQRIGVRLTQLA